MAVKEFSVSSMWGELAYARVPAPSRGGHGSCDQHGRMERVDPDALTIEKNGVIWEVDGSAPMEDSDVVGLHYCRECVDDELRTHDRADASDLELVREAIAEEWTHKFRRGQMDSSLFSVRQVTDDATPEFCPYCSSDLEEREDGTLVCDIHGELSITIEPAPEVPTS